MQPASPEFPASQNNRGNESASQKGLISKMKLVLLVLRLGVLALLHCLLGCGGGESDSGTRNYFLEFSFANTSGATMKIEGADLLRGERTGQTDIAPGETKTFTTRGSSTQSTTNIDVTIFNSSGLMTTVVPVSEVHIADRKTTYIYSSYNGTKLTVDASRQAGVQR